MSNLNFLAALSISSSLSQLGSTYSSAVDSIEADQPIGIESLPQHVQFHLYLQPMVAGLIDRVISYTSQDASLFTSEDIGLIRDGESYLSESLTALTKKLSSAAVSGSMGDIISDTFTSEIEQTELFKGVVHVMEILDNLPDVEKSRLPGIRMELPEGSALEPLPYTALETNTSIRLVRIASRSLDYDSEIQLSLRHVDLIESPQYATLSYTWGKPSAVFHSQEELDAHAQDGVIIPIVCNGKFLAVGENLYRFMCRWQVAITIFEKKLQNGDLSENETAMRPPAEFWIDAICIDQANAREKNHQVSMMAQIYSQCDRTWIWLGEGDEDSRKALNTLRSLASASQRLPLAQQQGIHPKEVCELLGLPSLFSWHWFWVFALLNRAWFQRSWVVQEAALSPRLEFFCGSLLFPWIGMVSACDFMLKSGISKIISSFAALEMDPTGRQFLFDDSARSIVGVQEFSRDPSKLHLYASPDLNKKLPMGALVLSIAIARNSDRAVLIHDQSNPGVSWDISSTSSDELETSVQSKQEATSSIIELWQLSRATKCFNPRDKIYAFYHLAHRPCYRSVRTSEARRNLEIDYDSPVNKVYLDAAWFTILSDSNLALLSTARSKSTLNTHELPSWVPDWSDGSELSEYRVLAERLGWSAAGHAEWCVPASPYLYQPQLRVQGVFVDNVCQTTMDEFDYSRAVLLAGLLPSEYREAPGGQSPIEVLWRTLVTDFSSESHPSPDATGVAFQYAYWDASRKTVNRNFMGKTDYRLYQIILESIDIMKKYGFPLPELDNQTEDNKTLTTEFEGRRRKMLDSRKLFLTESKYFGAGDQHMVDQDKVFLVGGVRTPLVLRPASDGRYKLIGEAYVHGIMHGEFMREPKVKFEEIILE